MEEQKEQVVLPKSLEELKKHLKSKNIIFGRDRTIKALRASKLAKIFISSNAPKDLLEDVDHYSKLSHIEIYKLEIPNDELGTFCKKTFAVSVVGMIK